VALEDDGSVHFLAIFGIGDSERDRFRHCRMLEQNGIDFQRRNFLSAAVDQLLQAAREREVAFAIENALVARAKVAAAEGAGIRLRVVTVAVHDVATLDRDLALLAAWKNASLVIENHNLHARATADRTWLSRPVGRKRIRRHLVRRLGHAVGLEDRRPTP